MGPLGWKWRPWVEFEGSNSSNNNWNRNTSALSLFGFAFSYFSSSHISCLF